MKKKPQLVYINPNSSKVIHLQFSLPLFLFIALVFLSLGFLITRYTYSTALHLKHRIALEALRTQNAQLEAKLQHMESKIHAIQEYVKQIESVDDKLRALADLPPLGEDVRKVGIGGASVDVEAEAELLAHPLGPRVLNNLKKLDQLEREIKLEKTSYTQLLSTLERKKDSLRFLPVLKPVPEAYVSSRFGNRRHPILGKIHFHRGVDLSTYRGARVIAPADGYVTFAGRNGGYGNFISINHKYGYETHYGHLNKILVRPGQFVKRGETIGEVGSTGLSTSPHLHYEVVYRGEHQNPLNYFLSDIQVF